MHQGQRLFDSHLQLVHLASGTSMPVVEEIPDLPDVADEVPEALWAGKDGSVLVATKALGGEPLSHEFFLRLREGSGKFRRVLSGAMAFHLLIAGPDGGTVYVATRHAIWRLNGDAFVEVPFAAMAIEGIAVHDGDLLVVGQEGKTLRVQRRHREVWSDERPPPTPDGVSFSLLAAQAAWLRVEGSLYARSTARTWSELPSPREGARYASLATPSHGGLVVGTFTKEVFRHDGRAWTPLGSLDAVPTFLAARSPTELYVGTASKGLLRLDGSRWSPTSYVGEIAAVAATPDEVLVLRQSE